MRIAITGASGFLGRHIIRDLVAGGHDCRGLSRQTGPSPGGVERVEWVVGSLTDEAAVRRLVDRADAVVHAAHDHPSGNFMGRPDDVAGFVAQNLGGTIRLIEAARGAGVGKFVAITSGAVHDEILPDRPLDETHPLWPRSHYGATKAAIEAFVSSYGRGDGFPICALRPTSIYGIADPPRESRYYDLIAAVVRGEDVTCHKGGKQVHAADVARAVALLLRSDGVAGQVYHCTDLFVAERHVAEMARSIVGSSSTIEGEAPPAKNPIACARLKALGMTFGGEALLEATIASLIRTIREADATSEGRA